MTAESISGIVESLATPFPSLRFVVPNTGYWLDNQVAVTIEKDPDGLVYDAQGTIKKLLPESQCQNPLINLVKDAGRFSGRLTASLPLDPKVFVDGDYLVTFFDLTVATNPKIISLMAISIFGGSAQTIRTPTNAENAGRLLDAKFGVPHNIPNTVGWALMDLQSRLISLQASLARIEAKLGTTQPTQPG